MRQLLLCGIVCPLMGGLVVGDPIIVDLDGNGHHTAIQPAINEAADGDTVLVMPGTYESCEPITFLGKRITVRSEAGPETTIIRMCNVPLVPERGSVVIFERGETAASVLEGFIVTGGQGSTCGLEPFQASVGGGILCRGLSSPTITGCVVSRNSAINRGGGISCVEQSSPALEHCTIRENSASDGGGGGIFVSSECSPSFLTCSITANTAKNGGGVYCWNASPRLTGCTIAGNSTPGQGGGIQCAGGAAPLLVDCMISGNSAAQHGGGMRCTDSSPSLDRCTIRDNTAAGDGGGMKYENGALATLTECMISENAATGSGGAVYCQNASLELTGCTISGNSSEQHGGGMRCTEGASPILTDCLLSGNRAGGVGGGAACLNASLALAECTISENSTARSGGAVHCQNASLEFTGCRISANSALNRGGGLYCLEGVNIALTDCDISGNTARRVGGGLNCYDRSSVSLSNCVLSANSACWGTICLEEGSSANLENCTLSGNASVACGVVECASGSSVNLRNCIVWDNAGSSISLDEPGVVNVNCCCIEGEQVWPNAENNIAEDPLFCGWTGAFDEVWVDAAAGGEDGDGSRDNPFPDLKAALTGYSVALAPESPCLGTCEGGVDMGADTGVCETQGHRTRRVRIAAGTYSIRNLNLAHQVSLLGESQRYTTIEGTVFGLRTDTSLEDVTVTLGKCGGVRPGWRELPMILRCTITGNTSRFGAGLYVRDSSPVVEDCTITANVADEEGGGIYIDDASPTFSNCIVSRNRAGDNRGAIYCWHSFPELINCTISENVAASGILLSEGGSTPIVKNCIIWGNSGTSIWASPDSLTDISYSCIEGGGVWQVEGTINEDPLFEDPDADEPDYHLQAGSPCIDTATCDGAPEQDIEGNQRPCGDGCDMGAYEYGDCPQQLFVRGDTNCDGKIDIADAIFALSYLFAAGPSPCCLDAADANDDGAVNIADGIFILQNIFADGPEIPPPNPDCGGDPTVDELECLEYEHCQQ